MTERDQIKIINFLRTPPAVRRMGPPPGTGKSVSLKNFKWHWPGGRDPVPLDDGLKFIYFTGIPRVLRGAFAVPFGLLGFEPQ